MSVKYTVSAEGFSEIMEKRHAQRCQDADGYPIPENQIGVCYVNAYERTLAYGGPEEGGWWVDVYEPLASIQCVDRKDAEKAYILLMALYYPRYEDSREASSAAGGEDLIILVEDGYGARKPEEWPRYE